MEIINSAGLSIFVEKEHLPKGERFFSVSEPGWWCGFMASGDVETEQPKFGIRNWHRSSTVHYWSDDPVETMHETLTDKGLACVFIRLDADDAEKLMGEDFSSIQQLGRQMPVAVASQRVIRVVTEVLECPLTGLEQKLFLSGKAFELIHSVLDGSLDDISRAPSPELTQNKDIRRVYEAREILMARLSAPPNAAELAAQVGLSSKKLAQGFKQIFGETMYAFTKEQRLLRAKYLLEQGVPNVSSVAYELGYHPAHLSAEFRRRFGKPPSALTGRRERPLFDPSTYEKAAGKNP